MERVVEVFEVGGLRGLKRVELEEGVWCWMRQWGW